MAAREVISNAVGAIDRYLEYVFTFVTWRDLWLVALTAVFAVCLVYVTPFALVLREDAYNFAVKGMEIALGDFSLDRPQAIGWPLLLGLVYSVLGVENIFDAMFISRWTSIMCTALGLFALGKACGVMFPDRAQRGLAVLIAATYMVNPLVYSMARSAMSEGLFTLLVVGVVFYSIRSADGDSTDLRHIVIAAFLAAVSYYVRPTGLFVFAALLLTIVLNCWGSVRSIAAALSVAFGVFVISVSPYLYARFAAFGSPFDYGPNSKYFVADYEHVWAENVAAPSFWEFMGSHSIAEHYDRFVNRGLMSVLDHTGTYILDPPTATLVVVGALAILGFRKKGAYIVPLALAVSVAGLSIVYAIFVSIRHLFYLLPLLLLCAGGAFYLLERFQISMRSIVATVLIIVVASDFPTLVWMGPELRQVPQVQDHWAVWAANNIEGTAAIVEGGDFVKMSQHYEPTGWRVAKHFVDVEPHINLWRPGIYKDLDEAMAHFKEKGVKYLITDRESTKRRPYLRSVSHPRWRNHFIHLGYFHLGGKGSKIRRVSIYQVLY
jgi:hypothetical protein